jgi:O-antigen/teichoic acid export membrane protein
LGIIATLILSSFLINFIFGKEYYMSITILRILSPLIITIPINALFITYLISRGKTKLVATLLIFSTVINVILNYVLIKLFIVQNQFLATIGVSVATVVSGYLFLIGLMCIKRYIK